MSQEPNVITVEMMEKIFEAMKKYKVHNLKASNLEITFDQFAFVEPQLDAPLLPGNNDYGV